MRLTGSCHCQAVRFAFDSNTAIPYQHCYCSICRKSAGGSGSAVNIMGWTDSLEIEGSEAITVWRAMIDGERSEVERRFCRHCGSALWVWDARWPDIFHPFASVIDSDLPVPDETVHIMMDFKANWVTVPPAGRQVTHFAGYPSESIQRWHEGRPGHGDEER